jgi:acetolactate decarboxylase
VTVDGKVHPVPDGMTTPFANVTFFQADLTCQCQGKLDYAGLQKCLDANLPSPNLFYAVRIDGVFPRVKVRSVPKAEKKPYLPLVEMVKHQKEYEYRQVAGTLLGFYCPHFVKGVNVPGWHLHFIGAKRQTGGHLLDAELSDTKAQLDVLSRLVMDLPTEGGFLDSDLKKDRAEELGKVETGK